MLHMMLPCPCIERFNQVEYHVIYELHLRNISVDICVTLKLRLIQYFVALQASR